MVLLDLVPGDRPDILRYRAYALLNAAGIGLVVGFALKLGVSGVGDWTAAPWQMFRLFATPFCVSSFSMLTVGKGYYLVIPPDNMTLVISLGGCVAFVVVVLLVKRFT